MPDINEQRPSALPAVMVPAMAYVPMQKYGLVYEAENALEKGTLFPDLDKPFLGKGACR